MTVRTLPEIVSTLDAKGTLEGLPFLPEMLKYCGRTFTVRGRVEMLIHEGVKSSMRQIENVVLLDGTVCDGTAHCDCRRACFPLWKTAWLQPESVTTNQNAIPGSTPSFRIDDESAAEILPRTFCQVTELLAATRPLPLWSPRRHYRSLTSGSYTVREYLRYILGGIYRRTLKRLVDAIAGRQESTGISAAPPDLGLQPGDIVEVKPAAEIRATLDAEGKTRGLYFMPGMWAFCGLRFRVLQRIDRMMSERTREMCALRQTVILEGATCNGKAHGGCQRGCYVFWKDAWLRRDETTPSGATVAGDRDHRQA